ncbi:MAG: kinase [Sphingobium sp.]
MIQPRTDRIAALMESEGLPPDYAEIVRRYWRILADHIAKRNETKHPLLVGVNGAQGSGKSTLCLFLAALLEEKGLSSALLSIDDLYLKRTERERLARSIHPLFATRGVPGTHDVALGMKVLDALLAGQPADLPRFDKAVDDRLDRSERVEGPVDIILFEGWCVGAAPMPDEGLEIPMNGLEEREDPQGLWRREINRRLKEDYARLFERIDLLVMLQVPAFENVRANRRKQEAKLAARRPEGAAVMDRAALDRFIDHYERLTRHMLAEMPGRADVLIAIDDRQRPIAMQIPC